MIPTRARAGYLEVLLTSLMPQASRAGAEVLVVGDGADPATARAAARRGARYEELAVPRGANAARNAGIAAAAGDLIALVDDDMHAPDAWLESLLAGVADAPDYDVFGGPIQPRLEGRGPRACGREPPPITALDLGDEDRDAPLVWAANMAVRRSAFASVGTFDEEIRGRGEEEEWERRYLSAGGKIRYIARAGLVHRRDPYDSTVQALSRAAYQLGRTARRYDVSKGTQPALPGEVRTLAGCAWHTIRRRCAYGVVMGAHAAGRLREAASERRQP